MLISSKVQLCNFFLFDLVILILGVNFKLPGSGIMKLSVCLSVCPLLTFSQDPTKTAILPPEIQTKTISMGFVPVVFVVFFVITLNSLYLRYCRSPFKKINNNTYTIIFSTDLAWSIFVCYFLSGIECVKVRVIWQFVVTLII